MKKLLLLLSASSLLLVGAGCSSEPAPSPAPVTQPAPSPAPAPTPAPNNGTPVKGGSEGVGTQPAPITDQVMPGGVSIEVTAGGTFSPATAVIKAGEAVTWTNHSATPVWIASNPHPTHTDYPGFDSKSAIPAGGTYSFTFTKIGSWGYHNHLNPTVMGTVIVQN